MSNSERTNYLYSFTYNSSPTSKEIFECRYVSPDVALERFKRMVSLAESPYDFKIVVSDEVTGEESSFQVRGTSIEEMLEKFRVFLEASTGCDFVETSLDEQKGQVQVADYDSMSNYEKLQMIIYASFKHGKFSSLDVAEIYQNLFDEPIPKSTVSTYLARMWNEGKGHLERIGNRSGYMYRLKTELEEVQSEIKHAEKVLSSIQLGIGS